MLRGLLRRTGPTRAATAEHLDVIRRVRRCRHHRIARLAADDGHHGGRPRASRRARGRRSGTPHRRLERRPAALESTSRTLRTWCPSKTRATTSSSISPTSSSTRSPACSRNHPSTRPTPPTTPPTHPPPRSHHARSSHHPVPRPITRQPSPSLAHPRRARPRPPRHVDRSHDHQRRHAPTGRRPRCELAQLQWIVASYTIVFAGLLLTAGSMGDRFGRRHALLAGLVTFLAGSVVAATAASTTALIAGRCVMGARRCADHADHAVDPRQRVRRPPRTCQGDRRLDRSQRRRHRPRTHRRRCADAQLLVVVGVLDQRAAPRRRLRRSDRTSFPTPATRTRHGSTRSERSCRSPRSAHSSTPSSRHPSAAGPRRRRWSTSQSERQSGSSFVAWEMRRDDPMLDISPVPQPQLLRRQHHARPAVLRHGRHRVPAGAVPPVRPRLHAAGRRLRARPRRDRDAARHRGRRPPRRDARRPHRRHRRHADRHRRRRRPGRLRRRRLVHRRPVSACCCSASAPASRCPPPPR